jgi:hypothetical protein
VALRRRSHRPRDRALGADVDVVMDFGKSKSIWIFSFWSSLDSITLDVDVHMLN